MKGCARPPYMLRLQKVKTSCFESILHLFLNHLLLVWYIPVVEGRPTTTHDCSPFFWSSIKRRSRPPCSRCFSS